MDDDSHHDDADDGFGPWPLAWHPRTDGDRPDPDRFTTPACCGDGLRPSGGLWTSPMLGRKHSMWSIHHDHEELGGQLVRQGWAVGWPDQDRTAYIDSQADLQTLVQHYGCRVHRSLEHAARMAFRVFGDDDTLGVHDGRMWPPLDFAAMSERFDAIYLTESGRADTWMTDPGTTLWSCMTVLWLNPVWQLLHPITTIPFTPDTLFDDLEQAVYDIGQPSSKRSS